MPGPEGRDAAGLFAEHGPEMVRRARAVIRSEADAEDAVQEAMIAVLNAPHILSVVERAEAWLYTVVRRRCVDIIRRDRAGREAEQEAALQDIFEGADAQEMMEREEFVAAVAEAADRLDEPLRVVFVENALEGRTFREISERSGVPMGTLMARKQKAVESIRKELQRRSLLP